MALQLPSSLTDPPTITATHASQPTSPPVPVPNGPPGPNNGNSIPFSFLIAFLALFVAFMAMGLWARRINVYVRRRLGLPIPEPRTKRTEPKPAKPIIWDVSFGRDGDVGRWDSMQPLSLWYRRKAVLLPDGACELPAVPIPRVPSVVFGRVPGRGGRGIVLAPLPPPRRHPRRDGASGLRQLRNSMMTSLSNYWRPGPPGVSRYNDPKGESEVEALQAAVFVAMPVANKEKRRNSSLGEVQGELALGIADISWEGETFLGGD